MRGQTSAVENVFVAVAGAFGLIAVRNRPPVI